MSHICQSNLVGWGALKFCRFWNYFLPFLPQEASHLIDVLYDFILCTFMCDAVCVILQTVESSSIARSFLVPEVHGHNQGVVGEGLPVCWPPRPPENWNLNTQIFLDNMISKVLRDYQKFYMIYPSAKTSHWKRLLTSTIEFWKMN
jgi:hypothetical protein